MTSSILLPRKALVLISPMTQRMASEIFDFAAAVGPYNGGDIAAKGHNGFIREGLKALDFDCL